MPETTLPGELRFRGLPSSLGIAAMACVMAGAAYLSLPRFDDSLIWFWLDDTPNHIDPANVDRRVMGLMWRFLASTGRFWEIGAALNVLATLGTALSTFVLWQRMFPARTAWGVVAATLSAAPILYELQETLTPVYQLQLSIVYLAALSTWPGGRFAGAFLSAVAATVICVVGSVTEYTLSATVPVAFLILCRTWNVSGAVRRRGLVAVGFLALGTVGSYALLRFAADDGFRPSLLPSVGWEYFWRRGWTIPFKMVDALTSVFGGALCREVADFSINSWRGASAAIAAAVATLMIAIDLRPRATNDSTPADSPRLIDLGQLAAAVGLGLFPLFCMRLAPHDEGAYSRFFAGVHPLSGCAVSALLIAVCRARFQLAMSIGLVFLGTFAAFNDAGRWYEHRRDMDRVGRAIRPHLAPGFTLILFEPESSGYKSFGRWSYDVELSALVMTNWTREERLRAWVVPAGNSQAIPRAPADRTRIIRPPANANEQWRFEWRFRGVERAADVERVLLVGFPGKESARIIDITQGRVVFDGPTE